MGVDSFEKQLKKAIESAVLKLVNDGQFIMPSYENRIKIDPAFMQDVWALVDKEKIKAILARKVEEQLVDKIVNAMATELSTDVKSILSVPERREALRAIARSNIESICGAGK